MNTLQEPRHNAEHKRPQTDLADLISLVDLPALVAQYAGPGRGPANSVLFSCPNPQHPDRNPSFTVKRDKSGKWHAACWSACNWNGDALDLVQWLEGCDKHAAANKLRALVGIPTTELWTPPTPKRTAPPKPRQSAPLPTDTRTPAPEVSAAVMQKYLDSRGWPTSVVEMFGLQVVLDAYGKARIRHPFYAPTKDGTYKVVGWQDRATHETRDKWLTSPGVTLPLYNLPSLGREFTAVLICEGVPDPISATVALQNAGYPKVAVVGVPGAKNWNSNWAQLFAGLNVITVPDNDDVGSKLQERIEHELVPLASHIYSLAWPDTLAVKDLTDWCNLSGYAAVGDALGPLTRHGPHTDKPDCMARWVALLNDAGMSHEVLS